jgi:hypothetical protein
MESCECDEHKNISAREKEAAVREIVEKLEKGSKEYCVSLRKNAVGSYEVHLEVPGDAVFVGKTFNGDVRDKEQMTNYLHALVGEYHEERGTPRPGAIKFSMRWN